MENELKDYIAARMHLLVGEWVKDRDNYDKAVGTILGWRVEQGRYWDLVSHNGKLIEVKKSNNGSIIVKLPQLAEILTHANSDASRETSIMVIQTNKNRSSIEKVYVLETNSIIEFLHMNDEDAENVLNVYKRFRCAIQTTIGAKYIRTMAQFVIDAKQ